MELLAKTGVATENFLGFQGFDIYWYGILIATGFALAFAICTYFSRKRNFPKDMTTDLLMIAIIGAIIGARGYYVAFEWDRYCVSGNFFATLGRIVSIRDGGLAIYGGVIGAVIGMAIYAARKKYKLAQLLDLCAGPLALGQAIGRWGNFFNQEAHGALVKNPNLQFFPYAVYLDSPKDPSDVVGWYQATFFYESAWCFLIFAFLTVLFFKQKYRGQAVLWYLALYGFERGIVEWLRTDQLQIFGLPVSALLSIGLCLIATAFLIVFKVKGRQNELCYVAPSASENAPNEAEASAEEKAEAPNEAEASAEEKAEAPDEANKENAEDASNDEK
ncbi:MAG: prolipoprotein diacylglyceryl transferase [Clostridia bacterium]|nr:prolipoprotein diacylglyceryl transferase [Clostridia bacterium]